MEGGVYLGVLENLISPEGIYTYPAQVPQEQG